MFGFQEFDWSIRSGDSARQSMVFEDCRKIPDFKSENYLRMADVCRQAGAKHASIQKDCLLAALHILTHDLPIKSPELIASVSYAAILSSR